MGLEPEGKGVFLTIAEINAVSGAELCEWLVANGGYLEARVLPDGSVAGLADLLFTRSIALGCNLEGWAVRYCFEDRMLADQRFAELMSEDDVPAGHVATRQGFTRRAGAA